MKRCLHNILMSASVLSLSNTENYLVCIFVNVAMTTKNITLRKYRTINNPGLSIFFLFALSKFNDKHK